MFALCPNSPLIHPGLWYVKIHRTVKCIPTPRYSPYTGFTHLQKLRRNSQVINLPLSDLCTTLRSTCTELQAYLAACTRLRPTNIQSFSIITLWLWAMGYGFEKPGIDINQVFPTIANRVTNWYEKVFAL